MFGRVLEYQCWCWCRPDRASAAALGGTLSRQATTWRASVESVVPEMEEALRARLPGVTVTINPAEISEECGVVLVLVTPQLFCEAARPVLESWVVSKGPPKRESCTLRVSSSRGLTRARHTAAPTATCSRSPRVMCNTPLCVVGHGGEVAACHRGRQEQYPARVLRRHALGPWPVCSRPRRL